MDFRDIIELWPSMVVLAEELSERRNEKISVDRINKWNQRNNIPSDYWKDLIAIAQVRKLEVTSDLLTECASLAA